MYYQPDVGIKIILMLLIHSFYSYQTEVIVDISLHNLYTYSLHLILNTNKKQTNEQTTSVASVKVVLSEQVLHRQSQKYRIKEAMNNPIDTAHWFKSLYNDGGWKLNRLLSSRNRNHIKNPNSAKYFTPF